MFAKLIDGNLQIAPKKLPVDGAIVYNPPESIYLAAEYKLVTFTDEPKAPSGCYYEPGWEEQTEAIVQTWTLREIPEEPPSAEELLNIIIGGES